MRVLAAHQPNYLPWSGFFDKMKRADVWLHMDDVQIPKRSPATRAGVAGSNGSTRLIVPLEDRAFRTYATTPTVVDTRWVDKHIATLEHGYKDAPYRYPIEVVMAHLRRHVPGTAFDRLTAPLIEHLAAYDEIRPQFARLGVVYPAPSHAPISTRLARCAQKLGCDTYLSGPSGRDYLDMGPFEQMGVAVEFLEPREPDAMSYLHYLAHEGPG